MSYTNLHIERKLAGYAIITLNRPDKLNALSVDLLTELGQAMAELTADPAVRGLILTGAGKAFAAGADIAELHALDGNTGQGYSEHGHTVLMSIERARFPVIAAVNGFALGGGCELSMACHIRLASQKAKFGQPEVNLGIIPGFGGTQRLGRLVGQGRAMELNLTGDMIDAATAEAIGLVNHVYAPEDLMEKAEEMMVRIMSKGPVAVAAVVRAVHAAADMTLDEGVTLEAQLFGQTCGSRDFKEGTQAFLDKREAEFSGE